MKPQIALTATYTVVDEQQAEIARLQKELQAAQEENGTLHHRIDCLSQALDAAVASLKRISCKEDGCYQRVAAKGWCMTHYRRVLRTGTAVRSRKHTKQCVQCGAGYFGRAAKYCSRTCATMARTLLLADGKKRCSRCKAFKSLDGFYVDRTQCKDGYSSRCKECHREYIREYQRERRRQPR